ncbi:MAG TPA: divalent metal cation transporter [Actinomycetota bacterium]
MRPLDLLKSSGSGLIAGASDIDPTTVATMAVIGATTVYGLSWLTILIFPILAVIQAISARIGVVTHEDLQYLVKHRFGRWSQLLLLGSILAVTVITIAADLEAGAAALGLLTHLSSRWLVIPLAALILGLLFIGSYDEFQRVLRYVLLLLLAYVVAAFLAHPNWSDVLRHTLVPTFKPNKDYIAGALALLGTTLTSYVYVWQTIEEAEDRRPLAWLRLEEADAVSGILFAVAVMWFILIASAATLGVHHLQVQTAQDAAQALVPVAGKYAAYIFGAGLLGSALLALPVLLATTAYVVGAEFDWPRGLSLRPRHAPAFYAVAVAAMALGIALAFAGVSPIRLLFVASIAGGIGTPVGLVLLVLVASDPGLMRDHALGGALKAAGWLIVLGVSLVSVVYLVQQVTGG